MNRSRINYTTEQLDFIKANCSLTRVELTALVNSQFGTDYKVDYIKSLCTRKGWFSGNRGPIEPVGWSDEQKQFIKENCTDPRQQLTTKVNEKFGTDYTSSQVNSLCSRHGWLTGRGERSPVIQYPDEQLAFIKGNRTLERKELTSLVNETFGTHYRVDDIKSLCTRKGWLTGRTGHYEKGSVPANKGTKGLTGRNRTSFKPGQKPPNYKPIGSERVTSDGYRQRKMTDTGYTPADWVEVHRLLWEEHNGPIPSGHNVIFIDGDKTNITIENLEMVSNQELVSINGLHLKSLPVEFRPAAITLGRLISKKHQLVKRETGKSQDRQQ